MDKIEMKCNDILNASADLSCSEPSYRGKKVIVVIGHGYNSCKAELQARISKENPGCEIITLDECPATLTISQSLDIPEIKLIERDTPLYPKYESQPWSRGYRNELNRNKKTEEDKTIRSPP